VVSACPVSAPPVAWADPVAATAIVLKVVDGDTVDIRDDVRRRLRIRLLGIDTPETKKPSFTVGCWGPGGSAFANPRCVGSASRSSPTRRKGCTTDMLPLAYLDRAEWVRALR